ncbi:hypothetical protein D3C79_1108760 [compost metagenome]
MVIDKAKLHAFFSKADSAGLACAIGPGTSSRCAFCHAVAVDQRQPEQCLYTLLQRVIEWCAATADVAQTMP